MIYRTAHLTQRTVMLGDFNIDLTDAPDHHGLLMLMSHYGLKQHINVPTTNYCSMIDLNFSNFDTDTVLTEVVDCYYSDHNIV